MSRATPKSPELVAERRFNQLQVERFVSAPAQALGHSNSRNGRVVQALSYFSLIRSSGHHTFGSVAIEKAMRQFFSSESGNQAAHFLPGQIKIDTHLPWSYICDANTGQRLEGLFADVENLPADFNKADSAAEQKGLREAFRMVSEVVLKQAGPQSRNRLNRELIRRVYDDVWVPRATKAFFDAKAQKELLATPALEYDSEGNISNLDERSDTRAFHKEEQTRILRYYEESMRTAPADLGDAKMTVLEQEFRR